jgi:hypothetical protein
MGHVMLAPATLDGVCHLFQTVAGDYFLLSFGFDKGNLHILFSLSGFY